MRSFLVDVNVWVALCLDRHVHYAPARDWFAGVGPGGASFCRVTQLGFSSGEPTGAAEKQLAELLKRGDFMEVKSE